VLKNHKFLSKEGWESSESMLKEFSSLLRESLHSILTDIGVEKFSRDFHENLSDAIIGGDL